MYTLDTKNYSTHPDDHYLSIRLVYNPQDKITPFATYLHNNSGGRDMLVEGHYFDTIIKAWNDYDKRGL